MNKIPLIGRTRYYQLNLFNKLLEHVKQAQAGLYAIMHKYLVGICRHHIL